MLERFCGTGVDDVIALNDAGIIGPQAVGIAWQSGVRLGERISQKVEPDPSVLVVFSYLSVVVQKAFGVRTGLLIVVNEEDAVGTAVKGGGSACEIVFCVVVEMYDREENLPVSQDIPIAVVVHGTSPYGWPQNAAGSLFIPFGSIGMVSQESIGVVIH